MQSPQQPPLAADALSLLQRCALFRERPDDVVPEEVLREIVRGLEWWCLPGGETLVTPRAPPRGVYLVLHGKVRVEHAVEDRTLVQYDIVGDVVGSVGGLAGESAGFTAVARQDTEVALLTPEVFAASAARCPALWRRLAAEIAREVTALRGEAVVRSKVRHVAIYPADEGAPLGDFVDDFVRALEEQHLGPVKKLDRAAFNALDGLLDGDADDSTREWTEQDRRILTAIEGLDDHFKIVLFQADPRYPEWTQRCIRQSDSVLVVSRSGASKVVGEAERELLRRAETEGHDYRLVLLHPAGGRDDPKDTAEWLDRRPIIQRVHHVRLGEPRHYQRLARHLSGTAVGLVLGGGGARGQAHLGVLRALRESGVHIDAVGGTSAGGGIAALSTEGPETFDAAAFEALCARVYTAFVDMAPFGAFSLPFHSLMRKREVERPAKFLSEESGGGGQRWIEDLWIPFFCVSCDIRLRRKEVHDRGLLWKALCATTALPGVLPPVVMRGRILVDGGVVDNVPVEPMSQVVKGPMIVVDVGAPQEELLGPNVLDLPVNADVIVSHIHPLLNPITVPNLLTVVMSTMDLADKVRSPVGRSVVGQPRLRLTIRPDIGGFGMTVFEAQEELVARGYNATLDALRRLSPEELAQLGVRDPARIPTAHLPLHEERKEARRSRDRLRRGFVQSGAILLVGLAFSGALESAGLGPSAAGAATLALVVSLLVLLVVIVSPKIDQWTAPPRAP